MTVPATTPPGPGGPSAQRPATGRLARIGVGFGKTTLAALGSLLAIVGATQSGGATVSCLVLVTATVAAVAYERETRRRCTPMSAAERREMAGTVVMVAVAVLAVAGAVEIAGSLSGVLVGSASTMAVARRWRRRHLPPPDGLAEPTTTPDPDRRCGARFVPPDGRRLDRRPTAELVHAWRHSFLLLTTARNDPFRLGQISEQRRAYLDELARRDPDGFRRWIDSGARAAGDPSRYLNIDPPMADRGTGADEEDHDERTH